jgi:D-glycero-D-manno-heptose 1,7-bisphosphate phosphatase
MGIRQGMSAGKRAVFLDRDGVLNASVTKDGKPYPPASPEEVVILPGVGEALHALKQAGFLTIVVTNQPDVARGTQRREVVERINRHLASALELDAFRVCYHDNADQCDCRKPLPGLLTAAAADHGIDLARSYMVGDRWRDIEAGRLAGCTTIFIDYAYDEKQPPNPPDKRVGSLLEAARWILDNV